MGEVSTVFSGHRTNGERVKVTITPDVDPWPGDSFSAIIEPFPKRWHILLEMTDYEMLAGLKRGDHNAAAQLVDLYGDRLLRSAYALCGNQADAQDLAQEALLQAVKSARRCRGTSTVYSWLHGILLNLARRFFRKQRRLIYVEEVPEEQTPPPDVEATLDAETASSGQKGYIKTEAKWPKRTSLIALHTGRTP